MTYKAVVTRLTNLRPHPNADRLKLATCCGSQIIVGLDASDNELGIYFPTDGQLSVAFAEANNLIKKIDPETKVNSGGMFDSNCRVRAQKLRGEMSDGFWCPISLLYNWKPKAKVQENDQIDEIDGDVLCRKYMTPKTIRANLSKKQGTKKAKSIMFKEHFDTAHLTRNIENIHPGSLIIITEKLHGTSGRYGNCLVERELTWKDKIAEFCGVKVNKTKWKELNGSRTIIRTPLKETTTTYRVDFRELAIKNLRDNLRKGETVYFEIVGYETPNMSKLIMHSVNPKKIDTKFADRFTNYNDQMAYLYGNSPGESEIYIYRITQTNEDGISIDLNWFDLCKRASELNIATVPVLLDPFVYCDKYHHINTHEELLQLATTLSNGVSVLDSSHIREGVVVRVEDYNGMKCFKHKSDTFKILESIIKDTDNIDLEEIS